MKFKSEAEKVKFAKDEKYFSSLDNYCLGKSLEEAGEIVRKGLTLLKEQEKAESTDNQCDTGSVTGEKQRKRNC